MDSVVAELMKTKNVVHLDQRCRKRFPQRIVVARCTIHRSFTPRGSDGPLDLDVLAKFYDPDTVARPDEYRQNCLDRYGEWWALDHSTPAWADAIRRYASDAPRKGQ
jgi:hypothetical protein